MGRMLSPDPSTLEYADPTNPQSFNLYSYGQNNPLVIVDPTGMSSCDENSSDDIGCSNDVGEENSLNSDMNSADQMSNVSESSGQGVGGMAAHWEPCRDGSGSDCYVGDYDTEIRCTFSSGCLQWHSDCGCWDAVTGPDKYDSVTDHLDGVEIAPFSMELIQLTSADAEHKIGCIAQAYGVGGAGLAAHQSGQPYFAKPFAAEGAAGSTSLLSKAIGGAGKMPFRVPTPIGGPGTGMPFRMAKTANLGRAAGRWAPVVGVATTAYAAYQLGKCY